MRAVRFCSSAGLSGLIGISASSGCPRADFTWIWPSSRAAAWLLPRASASSIDSFSERFIVFSPERPRDILIGTPKHGSTRNEASL
ncbi:hypothetical protein DyAD56_22570 [Dyella sp. AD56]|nr:hypothetical protein DyAD56_22570 [Dyella sp. AD56]